MNSLTFFWQSIAWQWPFLAMTIGRGVTAGLLILLTNIITKKMIRQQIEDLLPSESRDRILTARREARHYKKLYEEEREHAAHLRAIIKTSIITTHHSMAKAGDTIANLAALERRGK